MTAFESEVLELHLEADGMISGHIRLPPEIKPRPGQYFLAHAPVLEEALPTALFPVAFHSQGMSAIPFSPAWSVGTVLRLGGPLGRGFHLPEDTHRVGLAAVDGGSYYLLPLLRQALHQQAAVALYGTQVPENLPAEVEVLPVELLPEALHWADYLAFVIPLAQLSRINEIIGRKSEFLPACMMEVLVLTPLPCGGAAACGVCAVHTRRGWKLACQDGPVFNFKELE